MSTSKLKGISYFNSGGDCKYLWQAKCKEDLQEYFHKITQEGIPYFILGRGSNSLVSSNYWDGAVITVGNINHLKVQGTRIIAGAGIENSDFAEYCYNQSLSGAEWMNGLPGQLGGTTRMNARCYGGEISQIVDIVRTVDQNGNIKEYNKQDGIFRGYKDTFFMDNNECIFEIEVVLKTGDKQNIKNIMESCLQDRYSKHQFKFPSCGCVFKNNYHPDISVPSGLLLELAGAKDLISNDCLVSSFHSNFVYNLGAKSHDLLLLTFAMRNQVWEEFGVWLEYEMEMLGTLDPEELREVKIKKENKLQKSKLEKAKMIFRERKTKGTSDGK